MQENVHICSQIPLSIISWFHAGYITKKRLDPSSFLSFSELSSVFWVLPQSHFFFHLLYVKENWLQTTFSHSAILAGCVSWGFCKGSSTEGSSHCETTNRLTVNTQTQTHRALWGGVRACVAFDENHLTSCSKVLIIPNYHVFSSKPNNGVSVNRYLRREEYGGENMRSFSTHNNSRAQATYKG